jgi:pyrimidine-nucleoside phosphorylase
LESLEFVKTEPGASTNDRLENSMFLASEIIKKKRNGLTLSSEEIQFFISGYTKGEIPDYQMSAWLMSVYFKGMSETETADLTRTMIESGRQLDFSDITQNTGLVAVDKHSTGGVGDKTTLILGPIAAAAGVPIPMIAGRGLGHTGGTLDKLEAIPGFKIDITLDAFAEAVRKHGLCMIGQTNEICPADKKIYALRDVTATVESMPLICASIMSKKLAEGIGGLILDVKFGSGAFMKTVEQADMLAKSLIRIGEASGKKVVAALSSMEQVLGIFAGNSLEIGESIAILKNEPFLGWAPERFADCRELSIELAGVMIWLSGIEKSAADGIIRARQELESGRAFAAFESFVLRQGGRLSELAQATQNFEVTAVSSGYVQAMNVESIGIAGIALGAGRAKTTDIIEPTAGLACHTKIGDFVEKGSPLFTLYASSSNFHERFENASRILANCVTVEGLGNSNGKTGQGSASAPMSVDFAGKSSSTSVVEIPTVAKSSKQNLNLNGLISKRLGYSV